jgi:hypothetical protein
MQEEFIFAITVVHKLNQIMQQELIVASGCCRNVCDGLTDPQLLFITHEAWSYIHSHVTTQSVRV